jgi:hypothetical protein
MIAAANECFRIKNFSTMMQIVNALNSPYMRRLESVWQLIPPAADECFQELKAICDQTGNYKAYRNVFLGMLDTASVLPALSVTLKDLGAIELGQKNKTSKGLINFNKFFEIWKTIDQFMLVSDLVSHSTIQTKYLSFLNNLLIEK